jgi:hypothetical protein
MLEPAPLSFHLDLYRYWLGKRGNRAMPARGDIDAAEIPFLLPYIAIVHKVDGEFRYRLARSAIARQFGRELTGNVLGSHVSNREENIAALRAIGDRIITTAHPIFMTGRHVTNLGALHNVSFLMLPLSDDGSQVNMIIYTRVARFARTAHASREWLASAIFKVGETVDVTNEADLEQCCLDWKRDCQANGERKARQWPSR